MKGTDAPADTSLRVRMLGGFELQRGESVVSENCNRSYQLWNLLEYLVAHRNQEVSQAEIIEALWPDESSENPSNALKNLVYRIRSTVAATGFPGGKDIVRFQNGTYSFNSDMGCVVDTEEFERICRLAEQSGLTDSERCERCLEAIRLYRGDFLPKARYEPWVVPITTYYRGLYLRCVGQAVRLLRQQGRHEEIVSICERALLIDRFEESFHEELIRALIAQNRQKQALDCYRQASELFYREMGVKLSEGLRSLYREIIKSVNDVETDLEVIKEDLREASVIQGAFVCDYEIFKNMYQLEARSAARTGQAVYVGLATLSPAEEGELALKALNLAMDKLLDTLRKGLRRGDVLSRFSASQYVILLPTLTYENAHMVMERLARRYASIYRNPQIKLHTTVQPLDPVV